MEHPATGITGLFELNPAGTVLYSRIDAPHSSLNLPTDLVGQNFFDEIGAYANIIELRRRFQNFAKGTDAVENFTFTYSSEQETVKARVMLTQINQRESNRTEKLIILDIRKIR